MVNKYLHLIDQLDELWTNLASNIRRGLDQKPTEIAEAETIRSTLWFKIIEIFEISSAVNKIGSLEVQCMNIILPFGEVDMNPAFQPYPPRNNVNACEER